MMGVCGAGGLLALTVPSVACRRVLHVGQCGGDGEVVRGGGLAQGDGAHRVGRATIREGHDDLLGGGASTSEQEQNAVEHLWLLHHSE